MEPDRSTNSRAAAAFVLVQEQITSAIEEHEKRYHQGQVPATEEEIQKAEEDEE